MKNLLIAIPQLEVHRPPVSTTEAWICCGMFGP